MSLFVTSLNSGSNGNCYYIGNDNEAVLIDAGISCREIEKRMKRLALNMQKIKAVFVSHEHSDHIRGIEVLVKKYQIPVYITSSTLMHGGLCIEKDCVRSFNAHEAVVIGELTVTAFPKIHDAIDPCSFIIRGNNVTIGVFTDIGSPCDQLIKYFKQCHAAFLEANYDEQMLDNGSYPFYLKRRIKGGQGHLNNKQALEVFKAHKPPFMSHLFLAHLSKNNNCPDLVRALFNAHCQDVKMIVASRFEETAVYHICSADNKRPGTRQYSKIASAQLAFSFV